MVEAYLEASPSDQADGGAEAGAQIEAGAETGTAMEAEVMAGPRMEAEVMAGAEGAAQVEAVVALIRGMGTGLRRKVCVETPETRFLRKPS